MAAAGLSSIWDDVNSYLNDDTVVDLDQSSDAKYPAIIRFVVTNTSQSQEFQTDIVFEEVQLKVGSPPNWHIEKAEKLSGGQSFSYEHHCSYDEITTIQWALEGRVSPAVLLTFHRRPSYVTRIQQLPVKAYFDFLEQMNIHKWVGQIKALSSPNQDTTLAEMKLKENELGTMVTDLANSRQLLQDFSGLIRYDRARDDILRHREAVLEHLNRIQREIGDLVQRLRQRDAEGFGKARDGVVTKLTSRASDLDNATRSLAEKLGVLTKRAGEPAKSATSSSAASPLPIPLREIDLHTNPNVEEAIPTLERFIRESYKDNVRSIRIIHGKGIGVLRNAVRLHLESHKLVRSIRPADKDHGGEGGTEAQLVDYDPGLM